MSLFARHGGSGHADGGKDMGGMDHGSMGGNHGSNGGGDSSMGGGMGGMHMGHGMGGNSCDMTMIGNWKTVGTCFLSPSWYNSDIAKFAGSCIGVAFWVILTECIRRWSREYDRYIIRTAAANVRRVVAEERSRDIEGRGLGNMLARSYVGDGGLLRLRPTLIQQALRALLYAIQFTSAYLIKLIAMTFNGYILLSIILGAMVGYFFSTWDTLGTIALDPESCIPGAAAVKEIGPGGADLWTDGNLSGHPESGARPSAVIAPVPPEFTAEANETCARCTTTCCPSDV